eukprot:CAMPEP_0206064614 /NCGR_PEP_ID=MMETSP1466-20131121/58818_1 /ASSEMBLY_ACC=CAM_ASM_001126 /TAXON_ID=44452 /ORGANISM="Pavlova gyrans, Strain CCMP608" /LENGTH=68 /DNA_ID=CAMNT_0053439987 /DNA_START=523 /DNA_END=726 /DNA_ORIENTATION=-
MTRHSPALLMHAERDSSVIHASDVLALQYEVFDDVEVLDGNAMAPRGNPSVCNKKLPRSDFGALRREW